MRRELGTLLLWLAALPSCWAEPELTGRVRGFGARTFLPADDLVRFADATPRDQANADLRLTWTRKGGGLDYEIALEAGAAYDTCNISLHLYIDSPRAPHQRDAKATYAADAKGGAKSHWPIS